MFMVNHENYFRITDELAAKNVTLVAVSKTKPIEEILQLYELGQRDFGENYVQELLEKAKSLPTDIRWHFIGHLQSNKVKLIAPFVQLIQSVDSLKLLDEINKQGLKLGRRINCLLQVHIAKEETKFGLDEREVESTLTEVSSRPGVALSGLMGMATFTGDMHQVNKEFTGLKELFDRCFPPGQSGILSMGMSGDYVNAIEAGSNMVRIGSLLFGERPAH
jgi:pyridoxal phosphate enzyme (YggS family)